MVTEKNYIPHLLKKINDRMFQQGNRDLAKLNLTLSQMNVMIYLVLVNEEHIAPLKDIEKKFEVSQATMAGIVSRLEAKDFVEAVNDPKDKRIKLVRITKKGNTFMEKHRKEMEEKDQKLVSGLTNAEQKELIRMLEIIYQTVKEL